MITIFWDQWHWSHLYLEPVDNFLIGTIWFIIGGNDHNFICHHIKGIKNSLQGENFCKRGWIPSSHVISFHLSHQPHLYFSCHDFVIRLSILTIWVSASSTILLCIPILQKWHKMYRGGKWLKWKLIPCRWRNAPSFAELFTLQTIPKDLDVLSVEMITIFSSTVEMITIFFLVVELVTHNFG